MKTLLTDKEYIAKEGVNIYAPDYKSFTSEGWEFRGTMKQVYFDIDMDAYTLFKVAILQLGLQDYIQMEYDDGTAVIRIIEENDYV